MLGHALQPTVRRLQRMKQVGILVSDKRRRRFMKNPAALWWIAGCEPEDMSSVPVPYEQSYDYKERTEKKLIHPDRAMSSEDDQWLKQIMKTKRTAAAGRLQKTNKFPIHLTLNFFSDNKQEGDDLFSQTISSIEVAEARALMSQEKSICLVSPTGSGKCLGKGTPI